MQIEMFTNSNIALQDINNVVPKYIQHSRTNNAEIYTIICNIYLGGLISSYLEYGINAPITKAELLIDTNYFISLINLNTEDAYNVCMDLHTYCTQFGFRMSVLPSTVEQIKILLSNRIDSFAQKDYIGTVKVADIFSACKRRNIDKTQLELIRDQVDKTLENFQITILKEAQIAKYVDRAKKSTTYTILKTKRHNDDSALNDAIALEYVQEKRGKNIREFKDVQCWFLHNSYSTVYADPGMKIENKTSISASELLSLLWLASPSQLQSVQLAQVGLSTYVTKYLEFHVPADIKLKNIKKRADYAIEMGKITDEDFYHLCTRMSEGELSVDEIDSLENIPDEEFSIYIAKIIAAKNQITKDAQDAINRDREHQKLLIYKKQLQHQRDDLEKEIREISQELDPLETQRKNSFCDWQPKLCWAIAGLLILAMIVLGCLLFPTCAILEDQTKHYIQIVMPIVFCVIGIIASIALFLMGNERTTKRQDYAYQKWEQKTKINGIICFISGC